MVVNRMIEVNGIIVHQGLCVVDFHINSDIGSKDATHGEVYKLLDWAGKVTVEELKEGFKIIAKHGAIEIEITKRPNATHTHI